MRKFAFALAAGVAMSALSPALAQEAAAPAAPATEQSAAPAAAPAPATAGVPTASATHMLAGAEVHMTTRTELNSRTTHLGDRFELEVTDPVVVNGSTVIPAGSVATGEVTRVQKKGMWGRRGILETRLVSVRVGDHTIALTGAAGDRGRSGTAGAVAAVLLSPLIVAPFVGFFVTGTSAVIAANTATIAYTSEDVPLAWAGEVSTAAAAAAPAPAMLTGEGNEVADPASAPADAAAPAASDAPTAG